MDKIQIYKNAFSSHKCSAGKRGIAFLLTFEQWLQIWQTSGFLQERGRLANQYCMARFGDVGPYAVDNVKIVTCSENLAEGNFGKLVSKETRRKISEANYKRFESYEARLVISKSNSQRILSDKTKKQISEKLKGKKLSDEHKEKIKAGMVANPLSAETRKKISDTHKGRIVSEEIRRKISEALRGKPRKKKSSPL